MLCNSKPTFHYKCVLSVTYSPDNTSDISACMAFPVWALPIPPVYGTVMNICFSSSGFGIVQQLQFTMCVT